MHILLVLLTDLVAALTAAMANMSVLPVFCISYGSIAILGLGKPAFDKAESAASACSRTMAARQAVGTHLLQSHCLGSLSRQVLPHLL